MSIPYDIDLILSRIPDYTDPQEREAYGHGWQMGRAGRERITTHAFPNAYNKGYWEGIADREAAEGCS